MLAFDHVIVAVRELDAAAARFRSEYGLSSVVGGRHPGLGTGNRIVPLGPDYIELMGVVDPDEAAANPLGRRLLDWTATGDRLAAVCLRTADMATLCARLGLVSAPMTRQRPDGTVLAWHLAGLEQALGPESSPFFIEWQGTAGSRCDDDASDEHPGRTPIGHRRDVFGTAWVELGGDPDGLADWLGDHALDIRVVGGPPGPPPRRHRNGHR